MTIRYKKSLAYLFIALGALNLVLGGWLLLLGVPHFSVLIGIIITLIGIGYLTKPYLTVTDRGFVFKALIGPIERNFEFDSLDRVRVENNKILIQTNGAWEKVPISKFVTRNEDWQALIDLISSQRL